MLKEFPHYVRSIIRGCFCQPQGDREHNNSTNQSVLTLAAPACCSRIHRGNYTQNIKNHHENPVASFESLKGSPFIISVFRLPRLPLLPMTSPSHLLAGRLLCARYVLPLLSRPFRAQSLESWGPRSPLLHFFFGNRIGTSRSASNKDRRKDNNGGSITVVVGRKDCGEIVIVTAPKLVRTACVCDRRGAHTSKSRAARERMDRAKIYSVYPKRDASCC